jgi:putative peptide modification system cyclase
MDSAEPHPMNAHAAAVTPVLRTVLLCDIVESTALVERLGDMRTVALLQKHDRLLREVMAFCHGQLIDKADGVLALFERPIQALDFALRYQRGLRELAQEEKLELKARIGIHVGDVMMWANDPKDVLAGAKAFEVEGLAKPVAARLMNLALPGQILMSGMAQNLSQRAIGELGDTAGRLRWLMHGRYSFKGVPAPMLVHEVGEPGLSPLRAPSSGAKAWREVPLWRRPPVLAVELLLVGVLGTALFWTALRSPPAIAFAERDRVVVADLQNRTDEPLFDDALDTALRIGLEQSRHINLVSQLQIDRALERMQRQGQPVDRQLAAELALREGAKAVILPTIAEVGGVVRVSLEVIDPNSGVTVYSGSADGRGVEAVLPAMDEAMAEVRSSLGEAMTSIESSSKPLEQVTTDNIEALKAYSLALRARYESRLVEAKALLEEAIRADPEFAMAHLQLAFMYYVESDAESTRRYLDLALANKDHLSRRESLFLDGAAATLDAPERALEHFRLLANLYPDEYRAYSNYAYFAHNDLLRSADGLEMIAPALVPQNPRRGHGYYIAGHMNLALNRYDQALSNFDQAVSLGIRGYNREHAETYMAQRRYREADEVLGADTHTGMPASDLEQRLVEVTRPLDTGDFPRALAAAAALEREAQDVGASHLLQWNQQGIALALRSLAPDDRFGPDLAKYLEAQAARLEGANTLQRRHVLFHALGAGWMAAHNGDSAAARRMLALAEGDPLTAAYPANLAMLRSVQAELALADGKPEVAIELLADSAGDLSRGSYFERAVLARAYARAGRWSEALAQYEWLSANRGRAFAENTSLSQWQPVNLVESTLALQGIADAAGRTGQPKLAKDAAAKFAAAWPRAAGHPVRLRRYPVP